jgi:hypothetical protein
LKFEITFHPLFLAGAIEEHGTIGFATFPELINV